MRWESEKVLRYKCPQCGRSQYSSASRKEMDPCIYCDHQGTDLMDNLSEEQRIIDSNEEEPEIIDDKF